MIRQKMKYYIVYFFLLSVTSIMSNAAAGQDKQKDAQINMNNLTAKEQVQQLAELCWQNREKNTDLALDMGLKGIELAESANYKKELSKLYGFVGVIYQHYKNKTRKAIPYYYKSLKLSLETKDSMQLGYVYNNLGDAFYKIGNVALAKENGEKSMTIFRKIDNPRGIAYSSVNLGYVNRISHDYHKALEYFKDAINIRKKFDDSVGIASATLEVGRTWYAMEEYGKAMDNFKRSLDLHLLLDNKNYMAYSYHGMGDVYFQKSEYDSALVCYQNALDLSKLRDNNSEFINNLLAIALVYARTNKTEEGEQLLLQASEEAHNLNNPNLILEVYKTSAKFFGLLKQFGKASENYQKYIEASDSVFSALQLQTLKEVKNRFQIMEELNQINKDLEVKQTKLLYLLIITILLGTAAIALVLRYRTKTKLTAKLQASNHSKDKILSIISHDLISPFSGLIGFSEILTENLRNGNYEEAEEYSNIIRQSSTETLQLTKNLLSWARAQRNVIKPSLKSFDLVQLMEEVGTATKSQAKSKNIDILILPQNAEFIKADRDLLKTVLINLVNNAIKFSEENENISLSVVRKDEEVVVSVKDNGTGIKPEVIPKLFDENEPVQAPGTKHETGTGLGLLVCKEFVELHNGQIWVESELGKGSTFYFSLPV